MKKTGRPLVLTIKGKAEAVLLDAATYQEVADHLDAVASIRRGLGQAYPLARPSKRLPVQLNSIGLAFEFTTFRK